MKGFIGFVFTVFTIVAVIAVLITGFYGDTLRFKNKVKVFYNEGDTSIEYFITNRGDLNHYFDNGCIVDHYGKKLCGIRKIEILEVNRVD